MSVVNAKFLKEYLVWFTIKLLSLARDDLYRDGKTGNDVPPDKSLALLSGDSSNWLDLYPLREVVDCNYHELAALPPRVKKNALHITTSLNPIIIMLP